MPTPPRSYSAAAAEKLRLALLALAASAAVAASAQDVPDDDPADTDVLGEIPEDIEEGGVYVCNPCEKKSCASDDCMCDGPCEEGKPCTDCDDEDPGDDPGIDEEPGDDPEPPKETSGDDPVVLVGGETPAVPAPEPVIRGEAPRMPVRCSTNAPALPPLPIELTEADLKKLEAAGFDVSTAIHAATNAPAYSIAVETLSRALSAQAGYPITPELIVQAAKIAEMELEEFAREKLSELGIEPGATIDPPAPVPTATNATATPPPARLGGRRYPVPRTNP